MEPEPDYSAMTDEEHDAILERLVSNMSASTILGYGNVYSTLSEELNNEILDVWAHQNPDKAFPNT